MYSQVLDCKTQKANQILLDSKTTTLPVRHQSFLIVNPIHGVEKVQTHCCGTMTFLSNSSRWNWLLCCPQNHTLVSQLRWFLGNGITSITLYSQSKVCIFILQDIRDLRLSYVSVPLRHDYEINSILISGWIYWNWRPYYGKGVLLSISSVGR